MFQKLVTNLSSSPSLIGEVALYAKKLKKEINLRLIGIFVSIIAFAVQLIITIYPPEPSVTAHASNLIYGGITSQTDLIQRYRNNESALKQMFSTLSINEDTLSQLTYSAHIPSTDTYHYRIARKPFPAGEDIKHSAISYQPTVAMHDSIFTTTITGLDSAEPALYGSNQTLGQFAILLRSGDIVAERTPKSAQQLFPHGIDIKTTVRNDTLGEPAKSPVKANTRLIYTIVAKNTTNKPLSFPITDYLTDITEYADIIHSDTGVIDDKKSTITWPSSTLAPGEKIQHSFTVRVKPQIPTTAYSTANPHSYDCKINNSIGMHTPLSIQCPTIKLVELTTKKLPYIPNYALLIGMLLFLYGTIYYHAQAKQRAEEIRLLRHDVNKGALL